MFKFYPFAWLALPCALALGSCADKPVPPAPTATGRANATISTEWFVTEDEARTAAEHIA